MSVETNKVFCLIQCWSIYTIFNDPLHFSPVFKQFSFSFAVISFWPEINLSDFFNTNLCNWVTKDSAHVISGLYSQQFDRCNVLGFILVEQRSCSRKSWSWCHHCSYHDNPYQLCQCCSAKDIIHEVNRYLLVCVLFHGVWSHGRVCLCWIHRQEDTVEEKQIWSHEKTNGREASRDC